MKQPRIEIAVKPQTDEIEFVAQQIIDFNSNHADQGNYKPLAVFLRDSENHIVGGLIGETYWEWLHVELLWIHESFRGKGYGDALLATAEQEARKRDCQYAYLNTFSFQAPEFYQKRGYVVFGELPNFPQGHRRYFLKKDLC